jgi:hypothetical protein
MSQNPNKKSDAGHRDLDRLISEKNSSTRIDTLRKTYGTDFARGYGGDTKLDTLLRNAGVRSLSEYLKRS